MHSSHITDNDDFWENMHFQYHFSLVYHEDHVRNYLGDVGDGGRYLQGKAHTNISCICTCTLGCTNCSGCVVYDPSATAAI